jgi:hypothetical protein
MAGPLYTRSEKKAKERPGPPARTPGHQFRWVISTCCFSDITVKFPGNARSGGKSVSAARKRYLATERKMGSKKRTHSASGLAACAFETEAAKQTHSAGPTQNKWIAPNSVAISEP